MFNELNSVSTTTCEQLTASTTECITVSPREITYNDFMLVSAIVIFCLFYKTVASFFTLTLRS